MRHLGHATSEVQAMTSSQALREAAVHQATGSALAIVNTTGIAKGIYRFSSHHLANMHSDEALISAIAINIAKRRLIAGLP